MKPCCDRIRVYYVIADNGQLRLTRERPDPDGEAIRRQIRAGFREYLRGETSTAEEFMRELESELSPNSVI